MHYTTKKERETKTKPNQTKSNDISKLIDKVK